MYLKECHKYNIEPLVTIYHFDLPAALEVKYGGWHSRKLIDLYVDYCKVLFENFKDDVKYWLTNNEYNVMIYYGAIDMLTGKPNNLTDLYNTWSLSISGNVSKLLRCVMKCVQMLR
ncbi:MAG: family 1 glycosylhydrolase [Holdemanella porci]